MLLYCWACQLTIIECVPVCGITNDVFNNKDTLAMNDAYKSLSRLQERYGCYMFI